MIATEIKYQGTTFFGWYYLAYASIDKRRPKQYVNGMILDSPIRRARINRKCIQMKAQCL